MPIDNLHNFNFIEGDCMKLKIDGEYVDVGFWSFLKCNILTHIIILLLGYGFLMAVTILLVVIYG